MSERGADTLRARQFTLGAETSVAAGPETLENRAIATSGVRAPKAAKLLALLNRYSATERTYKR